MSKKAEKQGASCLSRNYIQICSECRKVLDVDNLFLTESEYAEEMIKGTLSHGLCDTCLIMVYPSFGEELLQRHKKRTQQMLEEQE